MTETEKLRKKLDERGEYYETDKDRGYPAALSDITWWGRVVDPKTGERYTAVTYKADEAASGIILYIELLTPEQASDLLLEFGMHPLYTGAGGMIGTVFSGLSADKTLEITDWVDERRAQGDR